MTPIPQRSEPSGRVPVNALGTHLSRGECGEPTLITSLLAMVVSVLTYRRSVCVTYFIVFEQVNMFWFTWSYKSVEGQYEA